jgi:tetratricopeptide (TPR) repeat protein
VKRINFKFLLILLTALFVIAGGFFLLRKFQVSRHAGSKLELARKRLDEGKVADATSLFAQYVALRPGDHEAHAEYAKLLLGRAMSPDATRNDVARAFNTLETAVRNNPDDDDLRLELAEFQLRVGRGTDAREHLDVLEKRLAEPPRSGADESPAERQARVQKVRFLKATTYLGSSEFEQAAGIVAEMVGYDLGQRRFLEAAEGATAETDAFVMLAVILQERLESKADARTVLEELVKRKGDDPRAWLAMTTWYRDQGSLPEAAAAIAKAIELTPDAPECVFADFELALAARDLDRAEATARRALELFPDDERSYRGLAVVLLQQGDILDAEQVLLDGVERLPLKASLQLMLTDILLQQNKLTEAAQAIVRIREMYGATSGPVGLLEARLLVAERRWNEAKAKLEQIRPQVLGNGELIRQVDLYLGQCHAQLNEYDAQLEVNRRILSDDPNSLAARAGAAQALLSAGKAAEALEEFETIAAGMPAGKLVSVPQVWYPLLQLRLSSQAERPEADRDWSAVDSLLDELANSKVVTPSQLALLRAETLIRRGESQAARELLEATATADADVQVWAALVTLTLRADGPDAATAVLARAPSGLVNNPALLAVETRIVAQRPAATARQGFEELEKRAASLPPAEAAAIFAAIAPIRLAAGDREAAARLWQQAAEKVPEDLAIREAMLETALVMQDLPQARATTEAIAGIAGKSSARSLVAEASVALLQARLRLAEIEAQEKPEEKPQEGELATDVQALLDQARNLLIEAEAERPGWGQVQSLFADAEGLRGNRPGAIDRLRRALAAGPANPVVVRRLVALLYQENRLEEAQQAMAMLGDDGVQGLERISAEVELRAGKFDEAVAFAEQSVAGDTQNHEDLLWLGQLLARSGKVERAGEVLERATTVAADEPETWLALFNFRVASGAAAIAQGPLEKAAALLPEPRRQLVLVQGYQMLGRGEEAGKLLEETAGRWPDDLDVTRALAVYQIGKGRRQEARQLLEQILVAGDDKTAAAVKPWARRAMAELEAAQGSYRDVQRAIELLQANRQAGDSVTPEDLALEVSILASRPEPASWRRAVELLDELSERRPLSTADRLTRVQLREKLGDWTAARDELVVLVANPKTPPAYVALLIEKMIAHGEISTAKTWLRRLEKTAPDSAITLALEAKLAMAENDRERAIECARRLMPASDAAAAKPAQLNAVAKLMEELGFPKAADRVFEQYAALDLAGIQARVEFLGRQGRVDEALDLLESKWDAVSLERALSLAVQVLRSQIDEAAATKAAGRIGPWIEKAKRLDPGSVVVRLLDAELSVLQGRDSEAEGVYRDLLADRSLSAAQAAIVANNLAFHLAKPDTAAEAKKLIDSAIEELGPLPDLLDTRGLVHLAQGDNAAAAADLREAILDPSPTKYLHLAAAELAAGDERAARKALESARRARLAAIRLSREDAARLETLERELGVEPASTAAAGG